MFCPPNFYNWEEIQQISKNLATSIYQAQILESFGEDPTLPFTGDNARRQSEEILSKHKKTEEVKLLAERHFDTALIKFWIFTNILDGLDACVCSPQGNVLKAPWPVFHHPDQFFYFSLSFPLRGMAELSRIYIEHDAGRMQENDLWERFVCIDETTGIVKEKIQTARHFHSYFDDDYPVSSEVERVTFDQFVKPFMGWSIVIDQNNIPNTYEELHESLGLGEKYWFTNSTHKTKGTSKKRGPKSGPAKAEFEKRYPKGIPSGLSSEAIAAELTESGYPISGRQVLNWDESRRNNSK